MAAITIDVSGAPLIEMLLVLVAALLYRLTGGSCCRRNSVPEPAQTTHVHAGIAKEALEEVRALRTDGDRRSRPETGRIASTSESQPSPPVFLGRRKQLARVHHPIHGAQDSQSEFCLSGTQACAPHPAVHGTVPGVLARGRRYRRGALHQSMPLLLYSA